MNLIQPFDSQTKLLEKVLDLRSTRQEVISANIANSETPGYSATRFDFEQELKNAIDKSGGLTTTHSGHIPLGPNNIDAVHGSFHVKHDEHGIGDDNSVSVRDEMLALSENQLLYETTTQLLNKKLGMLKYAITGGQ